MVNRLLTSHPNREKETARAMVARWSITLIIEDSSGRFYSVREAGTPDLSHVWLGVEVRFDRKQKCWVKRPNRRGGRPAQLVRKAACKVITYDS
jgi:hypothetical protein